MSRARKAFRDPLRIMLAEQSLICRSTRAVSLRVAPAIQEVATLAKTLAASRGLFALMVAFLTAAGLSVSRGRFYFLGVLCVALVLTGVHYHLRALKADEHVKINQAFFAMNGWVGVVYFSLTLLDYSMN